MPDPAPMAYVSTLTRRDDRVRHQDQVRSQPVALLFQPSPGAMTGCDTGGWVTLSPELASFQPSPGAMTGCDYSSTCTEAVAAGFNPHPAR